MAKEWTDDEVQAEIANAIAIVREDRFERFARETIGGNNPGKVPGNPLAPPSGGTNPDPNSGGDKPKKGLWWGEDA